MLILIRYSIISYHESFGLLKKTLTHKPREIIFLINLKIEIGYIVKSLSRISGRIDL